MKTLELCLPHPVNSPSMTHDEAFKLLTKRTGPILREHGFKGSGRNFKRDRGDVWQGINFQKAQWRLDASHPINFTLNLTLFFPNLQTQRHFEPRPGFDKFTPMAADQTFRVGDFLPNPADEWWDVDAATFEEFWPTFAGILRETVIPTMNAMTTREGIADACRTMPWMVFGPLRDYLGDLAPPDWAPGDGESGRWKQDARGRWLGPGEW